MPPPTSKVELPLTVLLFRVRVPPLLKMPPPSAPALGAVLALTLLLSRVSVPALLMPPPSPPAVLPLTVLLVRVAEAPASL